MKNMMPARSISQFIADGLRQSQFCSMLVRVLKHEIAEATPHSTTPHAAYIKHRLRMMKADERAIFRAAAKASQASEFLHGLQKREDAAA